MLANDWHLARYGNPGLLIETPEPLEPTSFQLPENGLSLVGDFSMYTYGSTLSNFHIAVSLTNFISEIEAIDLNQGVRTSLNTLELEMKTRFTNIRQKEISINGVSGIKADVEFKRKNEDTQVVDDYKLTMLFFADKQGVRQVYVSSLWSDDSAVKVAERIIKSVVINQ